MSGKDRGFKDESLVRVMVTGGRSELDVTGGKHLNVQGARLWPIKPHRACVSVIRRIVCPESMSLWEFSLLWTRQHSGFGPHQDREMKHILALLKQCYRSCVSHTCVDETKHPSTFKSRVCNNEISTCSKGSLSSVKVEPVPSKYHII